MLKYPPTPSMLEELLGPELAEVWQKLCQAIEERYDMERLWKGPEQVRTVKTMLLYSLRQMAGFVWPVMEAGGSVDPEILDFFYKGLFILAEDWEADLLLSSVMEMGKVNLGCMEAFGKADIL